MASGVGFGPDKDRPHFEVVGLHGPETLLDQGQVLITVMDGIRAGRFGRQIGFEGAAAVQFGYLLQVFLVHLDYNPALLDPDRHQRIWALVIAVM